MATNTAYPVIRQCRAMLYPTSTNQEVLHHLRNTLEYSHRHFGTWMQIQRRLTFSIALTPGHVPLQQVTFDHLQDCCNKSTAIYQIGRSRNSYIYDAIYKQWFHGHQTYVEFGTYLAKIINLEGHPATIADIIQIHQELCDQVAGLRRKLDHHDGTTTLDSGGMFDYGLNWEQRAYYKLRPIFRALIVVVDHELLNEKSDQTVRLVRTGVTDGLSAPITFDSLPESDRRPDPHDQCAVITTLETVIQFLVALERKGMDAHSEDRSALDRSKIYGFTNVDAFATRHGFSGGPIKGPSSTWVHCPGYGFGGP